MAAAIRASPRTIRTGTVVFIHISPQILNIMTEITFIILLMSSGSVRLRNVCSLQRVLLAGWAGADNTSGCTGCSLRGRLLNAGFCFRWRGTVCVGVHAVQIVKISTAAIGCHPIVGVKRHRRFRIADDVGDIERIASIGLAPERIFTDGFKHSFAVIHGDRVQLVTTVKRMTANDRGQRQFSGSQRRASLKPVRKVRDCQRLHIVIPDLCDLVAVFRPRLIVCALEYRSFAAAGNGQPAMRIKLPLDFAVRDRAAGDRITGRKRRNA